MKFLGVVPKIQKARPYLLNGHWSFPEQLGASEYTGFIYVIRDQYLKRLYLGKKMFRGAGKLNRGQESNWKTYKSSSKELKEHFAERPLEEFEFIALEQYKTKGTLSYSETWSLCYVEAPTSNVWYNKLVEKVSWNVRENITDRHKERLNKILNWDPYESFS